MLYGIAGKLRSIKWLNYYLIFQQHNWYKKITLNHNNPNNAWTEMIMTSLIGFWLISWPHYLVSGFIRFFHFLSQVLQPLFQSTEVACELLPLRLRLGHLHPGLDKFRIGRVSLRLQSLHLFLRLLFFKLQSHRNYFKIAQYSFNEFLNKGSMIDVQWKWEEKISFVFPHENVFS